jgi:hypothetical protein
MSKKVRVASNMQCKIEKNAVTGDNVYRSVCSDGVIESRNNFTVNAPGPCEVRITTIIEYRMLGSGSSGNKRVESGDAESGNNMKAKR